MMMANGSGTSVEKGISVEAKFEKKHRNAMKEYLGSFFLLGIYSYQAIS